MRFPRSTTVRVSFAKVPVHPLRVFGDDIIFVYEVGEKEFKCRLGMEAVYAHNFLDEGLTFDEWRKIGDLPKLKYYEALDLNVPEGKQDVAREAFRRCPLHFFDKPEVKVFKEESIKAWKKYVQAQIAARPVMSDDVASIALSMANHQVKGDDVKKALKARGLTFSGKVTGNYLGGYDFEIDNEVITFQRFLEILSGDGSVGHESKTQITKMGC